MPFPSGGQLLKESASALCRCLRVSLAANNKERSAAAEGTFANLGSHVVRKWKSAPAHDTAESTRRISGAAGTDAANVCTAILQVAEAMRKQVQGRGSALCVPEDEDAFHFPATIVHEQSQQAKQANACRVRKAVHEASLIYLCTASVNQAAVLTEGLTPHASR